MKVEYLQKSISDLALHLFSWNIQNFFSFQFQIPSYFNFGRCKSFTTMVAQGIWLIIFILNLCYILSKIMTS